LKLQAVVDLAKKRLRTSANLIGEIVEKSILQKSLVQSEERLRSIIHRSPFPIAVADTADEKISYWSQSANDKFGHTPKNVSEWYALAYPDPDYRKNVIKRWKPFLKKASESKEAVNTGEYQIVCKDGTIKTCELHAQIIPENLIVTFNDITERKRAEEERDKLVAELQKALSEVKTLRGILPICSHCKKIRNDEGYWDQIESYIGERSDAEFSHGICQECAEKYYPEMNLYDDDDEKTQQ